MSFKAREIMIGALPARAFRRGAPGFGLCPEVTRTGGDDEDESECGEVTRPPGASPSDGQEDLAVLRRQLRQAMSAMSVEMIA